MALGAGALGGILQGGLGILQLGAGLLSKKPKRPEYEIQGEYTKNAFEAEQMAKEGLPQAQYNRALGNINRNQAGALRTASNLGGGSALKSLNNILQSSNDATLALDVQDAAAKRNNSLLAMQQRGILAGQKQNKWDYDKNQPYQQAYQQKQRLIGAGMQNAIGGAQTYAYTDGDTTLDTSTDRTMGDRRRSIPNMAPMQGKGILG